MPRDSYFNASWMENELYKGWLREKNKTTAYCRICSKDIPVGNKGEVSIKRHAGLPPYENQGTQHKKRLPVDRNNIQLFTRKGEGSSSKLSSDQDVQITHTHAEEKKQLSISALVEKEYVADAEIRWCLNVVTSKLSQRSCDNVVDLFISMFPDSDIAKKMKLKKGKCGYVINYGIAPYIEQCLLDEVAISRFYALSFDESLNKKLQKGQMDILVRYWNIDKEISETRYLTSEFLGGAKADDILKKFEDGVTKKLKELVNLVQIGSDGPNVNISFLKKFKELREYNDLPSLLDIGTCGLHTVHGSMKTCDKSVWKIGKVLKAMEGVLHDSPARRDNYEKVTETNIFPLPYCGHRWCENENCLLRAAEIWPSYIKFVKYLEKLPKSSQPGKGEGKQFLILKKAIHDPLIIAKMKLMEYIAGQFNEFLRGFQTDQPMVPFICEVLESKLRSIMNMFIINEKMREADSLQKLLKVDVNDKNIYKPGETLNIGIGAKLKVTHFKKSSQFKQSLLTDFYRDVQVLLSSLLSHMMEKSPLKYVFARNTTSLNPTFLVRKDKKEICMLMFLRLCEKLVSTQRLSVKEGNKANEEYVMFMNNLVPSLEEKFLAFNKFSDRLDNFYAEILCKKEYESLWIVLKLVFCMFHGQSAVERGFNANKDFIADNQGDTSLISLRMIHDHMRAKDVSPHNFKINGELRKSVGAARRRYQEASEEKKAENAVSEKELKRKVITEEIDEVQKKKRFLESAVENLQKDADKLAMDAATEKDFIKLDRSNDLRKTKKEKESEIEELCKMEETLMLRKATIV